MGKATVYSHLGDGLYRVLYQPDETDSTARIAELELLKTALDAQLYSINGLIEGRAAAEIVYNNATYDFNAALNNWAACAMMQPPCQEQEALMQTVMQRGTTRAEAGAALTVIRSAIAENRAQYYSVTQEIAYLQNSAKGASAVGLMDVWCIDYDSAGPIAVNAQVGTIETFGARVDRQGGYLPRAYINIKSSSAPDYVTADNCIKPLKNWKTAAAMFAYCQWLYVMSRNPQHAVGTVLSKFDPNQTYLDVELFGNTPSYSGPSGYPFVQGQNSTILLNVPVEYLTCGAELFDAGDQVVVKFDGINRANPKVIGFAENPAECQECEKTLLWPYHGLAMDGFVVRPDATVKPVLQPNGGNVVPIYVNAAAAIISGTNAVHCGDQEIGGDISWLWAQTPTARVKVKITEAKVTFTYDPPYPLVTLTFTLITTTVSESPTTFSTSISTELSGKWNNESDLGLGLPWIEDVYIDDVSKYGEKVILSVRRQWNPDYYHFEEDVRGFLLLTMTSLTSATVSVLADLEDVCPVAQDDTPTAQSGIPYCYWFASDDTISEVTTSYSWVVIDGSAESLVITIKIYLDGVLQDTCFLSYENGVSFSGGGIESPLQYLEWMKSSRYAEITVPHNINKYLIGYRHINYDTGLYDEDPLYPYDFGIFSIKKYTNKTCGFQLKLFTGYSDDFTRYKTLFGNIVKPVGPDDPGTKLGTAKTAEFTASGFTDVLTVSAIASGEVVAGARVSTPFEAPRVLYQISGTAGGVGTYKMDDIFTLFTDSTCYAEYVGAPFTDYTPETGIIESLEVANRPYTSYQPLTGQLVRNRQKPICFM